MKLLGSCTCSNSWSNNYSCFLSKAAIIRVLAKTLTTEATSKDTLYSRLVPISDPKGSILPILDGWIQDEREIDPEDLQKIIRQFRKFKRFKHALEVLLLFVLSHFLWCILFLTCSTVNAILPNTRCLMLNGSSEKYVPFFFFWLWRPNRWYFTILSLLL